MNKLKPKLKLKPALITLLMVISALSVSVTYAWFAVINQVDRTNMTMTATVTPNLIISSDADSIKTLTTASAPFSVSREFDSTRNFVPCTHDYNTTDTSPTLLKYLTNTGEVDSATGLADEPSYLNVTDDVDEYFYVDYTVYIAATGVAMTDYDLTAAMTGKYLTESEASSGAATTTLVQSENTFQAASIDFYVNGSYTGTLNIAGKDAEVNTGDASKQQLTLIDGGTIPLNTADTGNYITVTMRCYYDGALLKDSTHAYINTKTVTTNFASLTVTFTATEG